MTFNTPVEKVYLIGPSYGRRLEKLGIQTVRDLLYHIPSRYDDFSLITKISNAQPGETVTIYGKIIEIKNIFTRRGFVLQKAIVEDDTGKIDVMWFNQTFLTRTIHKGDQISLSGKVEENSHKLQLQSPQYEIIKGDHTIHTGRLVPIYPETAGVSSKWLRSRIYNLLKNITIEENLDKQIVEKEGLMALNEAINYVHFPNNLEEAKKAKERLAFDELLLSQLQSLSRKKKRESSLVTNKFKIVEVRDQLKKFIDNLPFTLTTAQKNAVNDIFKDLAKPTPMNRLLQGDVGSGKTVVAALAMLAAYLNGYQSVIMAPTEILAHQHFATISGLLQPLKIGVGIATGSLKNYAGYDIIVGTHALLSDKLNFPRLGLVVIDEQHRFGVEQRAAMAAKGLNPHVLTMTATPIPRTIALTLYGDLDLSVIDEMPKNRLPVKTWVVPPEKREAAYKWLKEQRTQSFIICPLIEESEAETMLAVKAAKAEYERLKKDIFPDLKLGLIHGRVKPKEKDEVLSRFRQKKLDILVATPVVEVGIDIPSATIMVIEDADRFGLAQLHQLRGRVGRASQQSYCLLFTSHGRDHPRLKNLERVNNGLKLAEIDLQFRGPGQRYGLAQHGRWDLKIADFGSLELIEKTNKIAQQVHARPEAFPTLHRTLAESKINSVPN